MSSIQKEAQSWIFSLQFLAVLQIANVTNAICSFLKKESPTRDPYKGSSELYSDISIFMTALVMKVWNLYLGEITRRLKLYPDLAIVCGCQVRRTISKSHLSRRLKRLGPLPFFLYFVYMVYQLIQAGVAELYAI